MLAFVVVALVAVGLVTVAALVGTTKGLSTQQDSERRLVTDRAAALVADAYQRAGGWDGVDLTDAASAAAGAGARLVVRDVDAHVVAVLPPGPGMGMGPGRQNGVGGAGAGAGMGAGVGAGVPISSAVTVTGRPVGQVTLVFARTQVVSGRPVAWAWVGAAALLALGVAAAAAWVITRQVTRPVTALTSAARAFAAGDRNARSGVRGAGELAVLGVAFDEAAERVQHSEDSRRQMAADVAHELRTPLAALQAGLEELRDGLTPADAATLARLHDQALRLGRVVGDLAELSAAEAATLSLHRGRVDLTQVADAETAAREPQLRASGLAIHTALTSGCLVDGDPERLHQIVGNLLQNCARHCRPGDDVTVRVAPVDPSSRGGPPVV
ncbi:MAG TPA: histidine kinase dimerization/phospho-acceptor domain-containing protein, partial [Kineosporiaceae bacterium]|nr:histidine kinase dimerization/phospho-acceptor domain-containing protein [Kineosporiaceae bacterium]